MAEEKKKKGFALLSKEKHKEIASAGGKASHVKGTAHRWTKEEAKEAGRRGGRAAHAKGTSHKWTSEEARKARKIVENNKKESEEEE